MKNLSPGQQRIRELIHHHLPAYHKVKGDLNDSVKFNGMILDVFAKDPIIQNDSVTARKIGFESNISPNYINWLEYKANIQTVLKGDFPVFCLDRSLIDSNWDNLPNKHYYQGLQKKSTVVDCLFSLAENRPISTLQGGTHSYYIHSGILRVGGGGTHRFLAHVLFGEPNLSCPSVRLINENSPDEQLCEALLSIDTIFGLKASNSSTIIFSKNYGQEEAVAAKRFAFETSNEEKKVIQAFVSYYKEENSSETNALTILWLWQQIVNLRNTKREQQGYRSKDIPFLQASNSFSSLFDKWYNRY